MTLLKETNHSKNKSGLTHQLRREKCEEQTSCHARSKSRSNDQTARTGTPQRGTLCVSIFSVSIVYISSVTLALTLSTALPHPPLHDLTLGLQLTSSFSPKMHPLHLPFVFFT
ncbi:hypothetical protein RRG08_036336 [Elysia crispata]|uniref:Uncharacterized protein n=1 Tax=Elysia crispata TaxID=231223 RepID=A0AAE0ZP18_9GAST|nr:hypothetical protein RRG08_036336 [Elysia crispata]